MKDSTDLKNDSDRHREQSALNTLDITGNWYDRDGFIPQIIVKEPVIAEDSFKTFFQKIGVQTKFYE